MNFLKTSQLTKCKSHDKYLAQCECHDRVALDIEIEIVRFGRRSRQCRVARALESAICSFFASYLTLLPVHRPLP